MAAAFLDRGEPCLECRPRLVAFPLDVGPDLTHLSGRIVTDPLGVRPR